MTNEEAIEWLKDEYEHARCDECIEGEYVNALEMAIKALEQQPNRCDSCTHYEEQDGSNCYECIKGMADNFEAQPTDKCKGCYYNDGEAHAECVVCDKGAQPTDAAEGTRDCKTCIHSDKGNCAYTEECHECMWESKYEQQPSEDCINREAVEEITFQEPSYTDPYNILTEVREKVRALPSATPQIEPCEDCISREAVLEGLANIAKAKAKSDAQKSMMGRCMFFVEQLPPVQPQRKRGKWIITFPGGAKAFKCNRCNKYADICHASDYCPNCGAEMSGGGEDEVSN